MTNNCVKSICVSIHRTKICMALPGFEPGIKETKRFSKAMSYRAGRCGDEVYLHINSTPSSERLQPAL